MNWIPVAIIAYFFGALSSVGDKFILNRIVTSPLVYTFYVGVLSAFAALLFPFDMVWSGMTQLLASLVVGMVFLFALLVLFSALKSGEASRVLPMVGGFTSVFVYLGSYAFLDERLTFMQLAALFFLVLGGIGIFIEPIEQADRRAWHNILMSVLAAFLFGIFYILIKYVFMHQPFLSGFIWTRLGSFVGALILLIPSANRELIFNSVRALNARAGGLFVANKILAGLAFLILNYAIYLGSATLINALQGVQYFFVLALSLLLSAKMPQLFEEKITQGIVIQKITAVSLIGIGLALLVV
ncbi:MAG: DMT family transporter [Candidatus Niyogibacteria bacterium]|nr:DMT family transporter [Candidatus Niyogibacteria bacterium]